MEIILTTLFVMAGIIGFMSCPVLLLTWSHTLRRPLFAILKTASWLAGLPLLFFLPVISMDIGSNMLLGTPEVRDVSLSTNIIMFSAVLFYHWVEWYFKADNEELLSKSKQNIGTTEITI